MEREILYRGKLFDGEWIEGVPVSNDTITCIFKLTDGVSELKGFQVNPSTVGQYTGLTDKNGVKIFEGDILKGFDYPFYSDGKFNYFAEVIWFDNSPAFGIRLFKNPESNVKGVSDGFSYYLEDFNSDDYEVIRNIHDNLEMLGGEDLKNE